MDLVRERFVTRHAKLVRGAAQLLTDAGPGVEWMALLYADDATAPTVLAGTEMPHQPAFDQLETAGVYVLTGAIDDNTTRVTDIARGLRLTSGHLTARGEFVTGLAADQVRLGDVSIEEHPQRAVGLAVTSAWPQHLWARQTVLPLSDLGTSSGPPRTFDPDFGHDGVATSDMLTWLGNVLHIEA